MNNKIIPPITNKDVARVFENYPKNIRAKLENVRALIFETASITHGVGNIQECLKWGEPSYLTVRPKSGTTIRIDSKPKDKGGFSLYFSCQTTLIEDFRNHYTGKLKFDGNRAILFDANDEIPREELRHCIAMALTYHLNKKC